jgi:hypothetical protein
VSGWDDLRAAVAAMAGDDPLRLPPVALGARVVELRALIDGLEGLWSRLVRVLDGSGAVEESSGTAAWLRAACRLSPADARSRVMLARRLAQRAETEAALASGTISVGHARLVTAALAELEAAAGPELAPARMWLHDQWCRSSFRLSTLVGCWPGTAGIWFEIVRTASKPCSRATSR